MGTCGRGGILDYQGSDGMTYTTVGALDLTLLDKIKAGQMPTAQEVLSSDMLPFIVAAIAIPVAIVISSRLKKKRRKRK